MLNIFKNSTNLKDISYAYANTNLKGNFTVPHDNITNAANCFYGRNNSSQLNVIANFGTASHNAFLVGMTNAGNGQIYSYNNTANIVMFNMQTTNMDGAFTADYTITKAACGPNVTSMSSTYEECVKLTGSPVCGPNVTNMYYTYYQCYNLTGSPVCGYKVTDMAYTYRSCYSLTGSPVCGPSVTNMHRTYFDCSNLYGDMYVYSDNVSDATNCFYGRNNSRQLTISVNFGTNSYNSFKANRITNSITGTSLTWTNAGDGKIYCYNDTANIVIFDMQTTNMASAFAGVDSTVKKAACGPNVTNMYMTYYGCANLTGSPVCGNNVTTMYCTYHHCINLIGSPACGNNVTNMYQTYYGCANLTGNPVCGPNVTNMYYTYYGCNKLTGSPVCGNNVTNMALAYYNCYNLTGKPACGPNVIDMYMTYYNCTKLTGPPVCGPNVTKMAYTYSNCTNLGSNGYFYSNKITNVYCCFEKRNKNNR